MRIEDVIEKFDVPDEMCYVDIEPMIPTIILEKSKYLMFWDDKTNYLNKKVIITLDDDDIEEYLLISKEYKQHLRKVKLEKLDKLNDE